MSDFGTNPVEKIAAYEAAYSQDYDFEKVMVAMRRKFILEEVLFPQQPKNILEIGCGMEPLVSFIDRETLPFLNWITIEPATPFVTILNQKNLPKVEVIQSFFEESLLPLTSLMTNKDIMHFDLIVLSSLLHEVSHPNQFLKVLSQIASSETIIHINVPSAFSFHRRLAKSMALIENLEELGDRNNQLAQTRVYSPESLQFLIQDCGFDIIESGGYFLKPFTHQQMATICTLLPENLNDGLYKLGREFPELASEIYVHCKKR